jgi:hypothetical protein
LVNQYKGFKDANYCVRVTANDGEIGEQFLHPIDYLKILLLKLACFCIDDGVWGETPRATLLPKSQ